MKMKNLKSCYILLLCFLICVYGNAQQVLYISGDDPTTPELFIQNGATGFVYVQGGITANNSSTPAGFGTGTGTGTGNIVVNGAVFIESNAGTPGNIVNATTASFLFDYTLGGTASATALTGTLPVLTAAVDGVNTRGGTVHMMGGTQQFTGLNTNTTDDILFYNLSLEGGMQDKNLVDVNIQTGMAAGVGSTGSLFLHNNYLNTAGNVVWVRNTNAASTGSIPTSGLAISRDASGGGVSNVGMGSLTQFDVTNAGMITSTGQGRLRRSVITGGGTYLFPIGTSDKLRYRPAEIINPVSTTTYYARMQTPNPNQSSYGTPAPRLTHAAYYFILNSDDNINDPEFRLYGTMQEFAGTNPFSCTDPVILQDLGLAQSQNLGNSQWGYQDGLAASPGSGYLAYVTSVSYPSTGASCGAGTRITYRPWGGISGSAANEQGYVFAAKPTPCTANTNCHPLPIASLLSFKASLLSNEDVQLDWKISDEEQIKKYEIEKSIDGTSFTSIGNISVLTPGLDKSYVYHDLLNGNTAPVIYYRIKQVYTDGTHRYSGIAKVTLSYGTSLQVYPNPFVDYIRIEIPGNNAAAMLSIYDVAGKLIIQQNKTGSVIVWNGLNKLAKGIYTLQVNTATQSFTQKIIRR